MPREMRPWTPGLRLEFPALDVDHQRLLDHVNALLAAVDGHDLTSIQGALAALRTEAESHFGREETLMREACYPGLRAHCARHQRLLTELRALRFTLDASGRLGIPLSPLRYIKRWFVAHITRDDRAVADYLDEMQPRYLFGLA